MRIHPRIAALFTIILWSSGALFILGLHNLPPCLLLALSSSISLGFAVIFLAVTGRWRFLTSSTELLLPACSLIILNQVFYVLAFRGAPAAQVDLINYLWPSMLVLLTGKFTGRYTGYLVVASGAGGVLIALEPAAMEWGYLMGYLAAFGSALTWTRYTMLVSEHQLPPEFLCITIGLGAPLYWALHFLLGEPAVLITSQEAILLLLYGGGIYVVAYLSWGYAVKFGSVGETSALCYLIPLLSIIGLAIFGYAEFTPRLSWATVMVLAAAAIPMFADKLVEENHPSAGELKAIA
jgi:drug/metabolite transporter (DMT)-like permease